MGDVGVVPDIGSVAHVNVGTTVPPAIPIRISVIRVTIEAGMKHVQAVCVPADSVGSGNTPELTAVKMIVE